MSIEAEDLVDNVAALHRRLAEAGIPHAFGGALAAGIYGAPRATDDIDVNVFVGIERWPKVRAAIEPLGIEPPADSGELEDGSLRLGWQGNPVHLFFSIDPLHAEMEHNAHAVPFGDSTIPLVSPEHLVVRKRLLGRPKDERDIERILETTPVDQVEVEEWVARLGDEQIRADWQRRSPPAS